MFNNAIPFAVIEATKHEEHSEIKATIVSSTLTALLLAPLERILDEFRDKKESTSEGKSILHVAKNIAQKEGISGFFRGSTLPLFAKGVKHAVTIIAANTLLEKYEETEKQNPPTLSR